MKKIAPVALPVEPEVVARALDRHPDYRVLRRIEPMDRRLSGSPGAADLVGIALDVETTGLSHLDCEIIELAVQRFRLDEHGRIVETGVPRSWFEQPRTPIPDRITQITGIGDSDVAGRSIHEGEATSMISSADFVVSHNAAFDRPFVERRLPLAVGRPWACSLQDVGWHRLGYEGRTLSGLLAQIGWFYTAHRAGTDVTALLHLLDHRLDDGGTVAKQMIQGAKRTTWKIDAPDAPYSARAVLRARGYRWNSDRKHWSVSVTDDALAEEIGWASLMLYGGRRRPSVTKVTWTECYGCCGS